ncbi:unnamed protein product [Rotaria sordida]|uniref:acylglycerol lipase n=1 Tax=Rotaria sordida TaxID=392033 RepID=A0A814I094_9BILA|nr:unnamed protein product [Rotaria sordida]CAF4024820.1 unnamed protein product [Rotaria sordida]
MKPWGPNNKLIHVAHLRAPESKLPSIIYLSGFGISMYYVKPLLLKFVEFMDEPVEVFSFDLPGYGASESPDNWNTENLESELLLLQQVFTKARLRKPFILIGGSLGGLLAHLYYLTYPEDVAVVSASDLSKNRPRGGLTGEETLQWWRDNQQLFLRSSDNAGFIYCADFNHVQCVLDMELAANATKAILTQIHNEIIH